MTLGKKLVAAYTAMGALTLVLGGVAVLMIERVGGLLDTAVNRDAHKLDLLVDISADLAKMRAAYRGMMTYTFAHEPALVDSCKREFESSLKELNDRMTELRPLLIRPDGKAAWSSINDAVPKYASSYLEAAALCDKNDGATALAVGKQIAPLGIEMQKQAAMLVENQRVLLKEASAKAEATTSVAHWITLVLIVLAAVVAVSTVIYVVSVSKTLREITSTVACSGTEIAHASDQVASSSQALAQGASEQAASLEETAASTEEITSMTGATSEHSLQAADAMQEVENYVEKCNATLAEMASSMKDITTSSEKISSIIKMIDEIAFQTNILALNAAVEAARAGEAGRGFAVVADEVRTLAQRAAKAANDTTSLIDDSMRSSRGGGQRLAEMTSVIAGITEAASRVKSLVDTVKSGTAEQSRGIQQIATAVSHMNQVTQSNAAAAEEGAAAATELSGQSGELKKITDTLTELVGTDA